MFTVERRRRDKINNWIVQLSKTIPDCTEDSTQSAQVSVMESGSYTRVIHIFMPCLDAKRMMCHHCVVLSLTMFSVPI